jgi:putative ATP-dependent endonuclease of OLD family
MVKTFVADEWTLEYDLAYFGLADSLYVAACIAKRDEACAKKGEDFDEEKRKAEMTTARSAFGELERNADEAVKNGTAKGCSRNEVLAAMVYAKFAKEGVSKAIAAQYLAQHLRRKCESGRISPGDLRRRLPKYLVDAIDYVTGTNEVDTNGAEGTSASE